MRVIIWLIFLSLLAVIAASFLGHNDGLVSIVWQGWRIDFSLNLFVVSLVAACMLFILLLQTLRGLFNLPIRAQQWRLKQRDIAAQSALRDALLSLFAGRYARSRKAAEKAIQIQAATPDLPADHVFSALSYLISAVSLHRLRDTNTRDTHLSLAQKFSRKSSRLKAAEEGAALLKAEFAIDDLDPAKALQILHSMPQGLARRTHALRLKMRAAKAAGQPIEALRATRLLAKHKGFSPTVAQGLTRRLTFDVLDSAKDVEQLQANWAQLESSEKSDPFIASHAALHMQSMGRPDIAREWLSPLWDDIDKQSHDVVHVVTHAMRHCLAGLESTWLPRLDRLANAATRSPALSLCLGLALCEKQLWGKAQSFLHSAAQAKYLDDESRQAAWMALAQLAENAQSPQEALRYWKAAAGAPSDT